MDSAATINRRKYLKAPTREQILAHIDELGISGRQYERFFDLPFNTIAKLKHDRHRNLAAKFWHIVYKKVKPAYGAGFLSDYAPQEKIPKVIPLREQAVPATTKSTHPGLRSLKSRKGEML